MEKNNSQQQGIKKAIRKTYGKIALQENTNESGAFSSSCCGPTCCSSIDEAAGSPSQAASSEMISQ